MVKLGKNKLKALNKLTTKKNKSPVSNKIIKKKLNAEKKLSFQKEVVLKEAFKRDGLVKHTTIKVPPKKSKEDENLRPKQEEQVTKTKIKAVEKQKRRQKTQISDTKLLLSLMKKK